jgi:hypothetical protein
MRVLPGLYSCALEAALCRAVLSPAMLSYAVLCCAMQEVHRSLSTLLPRLPGPAAAALSPHLEALHNTAIDIGETSWSSRSHPPSRRVEDKMFE